jgi:hypothetical protein
MKNKIRILILSIAVLCISFMVCSAANGTTIHGNDSKQNSGTFKASVITPLAIYEVAPTPLFKDQTPEYVRGATYTLSGFGGGSPYCQYSIRGEINRGVYINSTTSTITSPIDDGTSSYNSTKTDGKGVRIYMLWTVQNGEEVVWDGINTTPHTLWTRTVGSETFGEVLIKVYYSKVEVSADATPGLHEFKQTIEVSYNHF